jgi:methionyl-tRNA synthetase
MNIDNGLLNEEPWLLPVILLIALWSTIWKGFALYRAGANKSPFWFTALLILNTAGILDILYLLVFSKRKTRSK